MLRPAASVLSLILPKFPWLPCVSLTGTTPFRRPWCTLDLRVAPCEGPQQVREAKVQALLSQAWRPVYCKKIVTCKIPLGHFDFNQTLIMLDLWKFQFISMLSRPEKWPEGVYISLRIWAVIILVLPRVAVAGSWCAHTAQVAKKRLEGHTVRLGPLCWNRDEFVSGLRITANCLRSFVCLKDLTPQLLAYFSVSKADGCRFWQSHRSASRGCREHVVWHC